MVQRSVEVLILGAGGAGLMCAIHAGRRGRNVLVLDHAKKIGGKILISGGGRCNFTNVGAGPANYVSKNPHFCKSALSRFTPEMFIDLVKEHHIAFHEKKLGQLFCDSSAEEIVQLLEMECVRSKADVQINCPIQKISPAPDGVGFLVEIANGLISCQSLVIATGGLSLPKLGATDFGFRIAKQFGLKIVPTVPALDGFTFGDAELQTLKELSGVSIDCVIKTNGVSFRENILFTHSGLSGPAALQASLHWSKGDEVTINLLPEILNESGQRVLNAFEWFMHKKHKGARGLVRNILGEKLPARFADRFCELYLPATNAELILPQVSERDLKVFCELIHAWKITPSGTVGYGKAEVTRGGVDTDELSSKTMESKKVPGLYFIGEVVDVTGWLGGYNFQWAWASGWAAGQAV